MPTNPTPITALPAAPDRSDRATFSSRATAMFDAIKNLFVSEANALASTTYANANEAVTAASSALSSANAAATSASNASASAGNAATSASSAASLVEKYLGARATDPTQDNSGNALTAGDWYINTGTGLLRVYTGSAWTQGISSVSGVTSVNGSTGDVVVQGFTLAQAQATALSF